MLLTYAGVQPPEGTWLIMSRIGDAYYLGHFFLVPPLLARIERPRPLAMGFRQAVLPVIGLAKP
jgi:ubiquinol-cytochrome c reductase cytochrome b subunit